MTNQLKYKNDPFYRRLVDNIESLIHNAQFTPSEIREAAVLACIHFEMSRPYLVRPIPSEVNEALNIIQKYRTQEIK